MHTKPYTYQGIRRGTATLTDYLNAREKVGRVKCEQTDNRAFLSAHAPEADLKRAQEMCATCPFQTGCQFFAHTKVFKNFDGVMGGEVFYDEIPEEQVQV